MLECSDQSRGTAVLGEYLDAFWSHWSPNGLPDIPIFGPTGRSYFGMQVAEAWRGAMILWILLAWALWANRKAA